MTKFVGFELLIANALIHEMESSGKRYISINHAKKYAQKVSKNLDQAGVRHVVLYDRNRFQECEQDFIANIPAGVVVVNNGISNEDLRDRYRGMLSYEVLEACVKAEKEFDSNKEKI